MRSLDTNVLMRFLTGDTPAQSAIALAVLSQPAIVTVTVALELYWVLRSRIGWTKDQVAQAFGILFKIDTLTFAGGDAVATAITQSQSGADFADMLHLALSGGADSFATFDRAMAKFGTGGLVPVEVLGSDVLR